MDFRTPGWVCSSKQAWWSSLTICVLEVIDANLKLLRLHEAIRATCFRINISVSSFYAILEMYCPASGTFFTPAGELRMALHEMWEVCNLPMGFKPYEEYFPCVDELAQMEKNEPALRETYQELMAIIIFA